MTPEVRSLALQLTTLDKLIAEAEAHTARLRERRIEVMQSIRWEQRKAGVSA